MSLLKVSIKGTMPSGEVWSINPVWDLNSSTVFTFDQLNTIATAINAVVPGTTLMQQLTVDTPLTGVRLEQRALTGALITQLEQDRAIIAAGTGTATHPLQTAMVFSLVTNAVGANFRGRLYWPCTGGAISAGTHRFSITNVTNLLANMRTYLSAIEAAIKVTSTTAELVVWSRTLGSDAVVNKIRMGNVPDTQRRRRDKLVETYTSTVYP